MCSKACRAGLRFVSLSCFCLARQLPESITALLSCQQLFYTFLRKFLWIVKQAAFFQVLGDKKMKRTILSITSVHFIFLSGERGIWTLAPVLPTYSLSRGAPSTSWVLLQTDDADDLFNLHETCKSRREWDSNPRALSDKRFSRPPRYDRFDTSPYRFYFLCPVTLL